MAEDRYDLETNKIEIGDQLINQRGEEVYLEKIRELDLGKKETYKLLAKDRRKRKEIEITLLKGCGFIKKEKILTS